MFVQNDGSVTTAATLDPMPKSDLQRPISVEVAEERRAVVRWLRDAAKERECPRAVAQLLNHEADGIERGLHRING